MMRTTEKNILLPGVVTGTPPYVFVVNNCRHKMFKSIEIYEGYG